MVLIKRKLKNTQGLMGWGRGGCPQKQKHGRGLLLKAGAGLASSPLDAREVLCIPQDQSVSPFGQQEPPSSPPPSKGGLRAETCRQETGQWNNTQNISCQLLSCSSSSGRNATNEVERCDVSWKVKITKISTDSLWQRAELRQPRSSPVKMDCLCQKQQTAIGGPFKSAWRKTHRPHQ